MLMLWTLSLLFVSVKKDEFVAAHGKFEIWKQGKDLCIAVAGKGCSPKRRRSRRPSSWPMLLMAPLTPKWREPLISLAEAIETFTATRLSAERRVCSFAVALGL